MRIFYSTLCSSGVIQTCIRAEDPILVCRPCKYSSNKSSQYNTQMAINAKSGSSTPSVHVGSLPPLYNEVSSNSQASL